LGTATLQQLQQRVQSQSLFEICRVPTAVDEVNAATASTEPSLLELCRVPTAVDEVNAATDACHSLPENRLTLTCGTKIA